MQRAARIVGIVALTCLAAAGAETKPQRSSTYLGVSREAMIAKVKVSPLRQVDNLESYCDGDKPIGPWLARLTASETASVTWTAGKCELTNRLNPLDAGGDYCVQATLRLKHPHGKGDEPTLEFYLESPKRGAPGAVYAFRDVFVTEGEADYERDRRTFESQWRDRFKDAPLPPCEDA